MLTPVKRSSNVGAFVASMLGLTKHFKEPVAEPETAIKLVTRAPVDEGADVPVIFKRARESVVEYEPVNKFGNR